MNIREFEYLVELSKAGSISKASKALYISQPALSKFLQKLEREAGTPLFQHVGRQLVPTYAGEQCIQAATEIIFIHKRLQSSLADISQQKSGQIKFGLPLSRSHYFLSGILPRFYREYPDICINVYEDATKVLLKKLRMGEINLIFGNLSEIHEELTYEIVSEEEMVLAVPECFHLEQYAVSQKPYRYPVLKPEHWRDCPFLRLSEDQISRAFADKYLEENHIIPKTALQIRNLAQILFSVQQGIGVTICPSMPILKYEGKEPVRYFSLFSEQGPTLRKTAIIYRKDAYLSVAEKILIWMIKEYYHTSG